MGVVDDLTAQITLGKIVFDNSSETLKKELLGQNDGVVVTESLQKLILEIAKLANIRISSLIRSEGHHGNGKAVDIGNEEVASTVLPSIAKSARVDDLSIDEIIFDASVAGEVDRNKWNYNAGQKHDFDAPTLDQHKNHIHIAVK